MANRSRTRTPLCTAALLLSVVVLSACSNGAAPAPQRAYYTFDLDYEFDDYIISHSIQIDNKILNYEVSNDTFIMLKGTEFECEIGTRLDV